MPISTAAIRAKTFSHNLGVALQKAAIVAALGIMVISPNSAGAGSLGPKKASDVVTVSNFYANACTQTIPQLKSGVFNRLEASDGGNSVFSIPVGKALVVTSASFTAFSSDGGAGHVIELTFARGSINSPIAIYSGTSTSNFGRVDFRFAEPTGAIIKSGTEVCVFARDVTTSNPAFAINAVLYGFLVSDK